MSSLLSKIQPKGGAFIQSQKFMTWKVEQDIFPHDSVMYVENWVVFSGFDYS